MKNLMSMVDFVLKQDKLIHKCDNKAFAKSILKYANFLKQPLELWMFIPCDEDGDVLDEKIIWADPDKDYIFESDKFDKYQQAKERCLFEGFELKIYNTDEYDNIESVVKYNSCYVGIKYKNEKLIRLNDISKQETIEDLVAYGLQLTQTAIKQLQS